MANNIRIGSFFDKKAEQGVKGLEDSVKRLRAQGAKGLGLGIGVAAAQKGFAVLDGAIAGLIGGVTDSIAAASNLNEVQTKSAVVFGKNADAMENWSDKASTAFGQSKRQALDAASGFGDLLRVSGLLGDETVGMSQKLTELAADLASFNNVSVDDALIALKSGLVGEAEPMRRFGVLLSEARVKAKAYELGIARVGATLTEGQKVQARYAVIMGDSTSAQGDFERTSDGLANTQRSLTAAMEDASAEIGEVLLPAVTNLAHAVRDNLAPALHFLQEVGAGAEDQNRRISESTKELGDVWHTVYGQQATLPLDILGNLQRRTEAYRSSLARVSAMSDRTKDDMAELGDTGHTAARGILETRSAAIRTAAKLDDLKDAASDAASEIAEAVYGTSGLKGRKAVLNMDLQDAIRHLEKLERIKEPTRAQRKDMHETRGEIADLRTDIVSVTEKLVLLGDKPSKDQLEAWLINKGKRLDEIGAKARAARRRLQGLGVFSEPVDPTGGHGRAAGGPVMAGVPYTVGERGRETFVPETDGMIVPHGAAWGGGGVSGPVTIQFVVDGSVLASIVDRRLALAAGRAPRTSYSR